MSTPVTLTGRLTRDPELKFRQAGTALLRFSVVTSRRVKDRESGEWRDDSVTFWDCTAFGDLATNAADSLEKGTGVIVAGNAEQDEWVTKDGEKRRSMKVTVDDVAVSLRFRSAKVAKISGHAEAKPAGSAAGAGPFCGRAAFLMGVTCCVHGGKHTADCFSLEEHSCPGCQVAVSQLRLWCRPDTRPLLKCTRCRLACPDCVSEVRVTEGKTGFRARVVHGFLCPWYGRFLDGEVTGEIPCGMRVVHRGPYARRPKAAGEMAACSDACPVCDPGVPDASPAQASVPVPGGTATFHECTGCGTRWVTFWRDGWRVERLLVPVTREQAAVNRGVLEEALDEQQREQEYGRGTAA